MRQSRHVVAGVDEAGRGPVAGPVVAAACVLGRLPRSRDGSGWSPRSAPDVRIADSKLLTQAGRERACVWLQTHARYGIGRASVAEIDRLGIRQATELAMRRAIEALRRVIRVDSLIVDGNDRFEFELPSQSRVGGDRTVCSVAAASILAKVTRDRYMIELSAQFPQYGFSQHKGYGTTKHRMVVQQYGPTPQHRSLFTKTWLRIG